MSQPRWNGWHPVLRGGDWWDAPTPPRIFDQHFGQGMLEPFFGAVDPSFYAPPMTQYWLRPRAHNQQRGGGTSEVVSDADRFAINLDVSHFQPNELTVKTVDNLVVVEGKHEEKMDEHGFVSRQFVRKYALPKNVKPEDVKSTLSHDGTLTIEAMKQPVEGTTERSVPINAASAPERIQGAAAAEKK